MKDSIRNLLGMALCVGLVCPPAALSFPQEKGKEQEADKERKKRDKELAKELDTPYKKWLEEDVGYIITSEERSAFLRLATNEEREQFIEQFWIRRDPTPDTIENENREEHYRRIAYANERFASGIPGWKTDRGRIYIIHGPPDSIEGNPAGGMYDRPPEEGGGQTSTHPFELWRYRYIEGMGNEIIVEFVDPTGTGEFRLTMDPSEKDALTMVPGAGLTLLEQMGMASKTDRFNRTDGTRLGKSIGGEPMSMNEFERLERYANIQKAPEIKFKDLEEQVNSRIVRNQMKFDYRFDFMRVAGDSVLVPITVAIPNRELTFESSDGVNSAAINLFGRITTLTGRRVQVFEDVITRDIPESLLEASVKGTSVYQKAIPLRPGLYRLDIVLKDVHSGNVGVVNTRLAVPRYNEEKLATSTLVLADLIEPVPTKTVGLGQFVLGASKVRPKVDGEFTTDERLGIYLQVYNLKVDEKGKSSASIHYIVSKGKDEILNATETNADLKQHGQQLTLEKLLALTSLEPGKYQLRVKITDNNSQETISPPAANFTVKAAETTSARR